MVAIAATMTRLALFCILLGASLATEQYKRYDKYTVLQISPENEDQLAAIRSLEEHTRVGGVFQNLDFWRRPSRINAPIDIMVRPDDVLPLRLYLSGRNIHPKVVVDDVQKMLDKQQAQMNQARPFKAGDDLKNFDIEQYHSIDEIYSWVNELIKTYPDRVSTVSIGPSFEKRDMKLVKIGTKGTKKPGYFVDAGLHAREWISVSTNVYIINELVTKYDTNPTYKEMVDKIDFYIIPTGNPDGYEYTRNKDRMWRKTRSGPFGTGKCMGVDPNRNWDFHWMESGSSSSPCSEVFAGPKAFSESECLNMANFLGSNNDTMQAYVTLHSYSDLFFYPYGYAPKKYPPDVEELKVVAKDGAAAIKAVHGTVFEVGTKPETLYADSGTSDDWAKGVANIKWTFSLELRPGPGDPDPDQGYGFALPPEYILRVGEETWAGMQVIAKKLL